MFNIFTQYSINGGVNSQGKAYIGVYGQNPIDNPLTVYTDINKTNSISGFSIDLDYNGLPLLNGQRVEIYTDESFSLQVADSQNAYLFVDWVNFDLGVSNEDSKNWVKTLVSTDENSAAINDDGKGNYDITVYSTAGGNVRTDSSNTYDNGTTQTMDALAANTAVVNGVNLETKNNSQDAAIAANASAAANAQATANTAQATALSAITASTQNGAISITVPEDRVYTISTANNASLSSSGILYVIVKVLNVNNRTGEKIFGSSVYSYLSQPATTSFIDNSGFNSGADYIYSGVALSNDDASTQTVRGIASASIGLKAGDEIEVFIGANIVGAPYSGDVSLSIS